YRIWGESWNRNNNPNLCFGELLACSLMHDFKCSYGVAVWYHKKLKDITPTNPNKVPLQRFAQEESNDHMIT
ncbi:hypothetical protein GIB67_026254, partial [Kingdonia uniflora]